MDKIIEILKENEALQFASLEEKDSLILEKRPQVAEIRERKRKDVEGIISQEVSSEKFNAILTKVDENQIQADISQALPTGTPFGDYGEIDNVLDEGKTHLKHEAGEVLLVDVWATWCGPCQRPMQHNQEMLEKNEAAWGTKVRITAVSVDDSKELVAQRIAQKKWTKIQHLTLNKWDGEHKLIKNFAISGIPFVCLVDKFGKINYTGHPSSINLEQRINDLLAQIKEEDSAAPAAPAPGQVPDNKSSEELLARLTTASIAEKFKNTELLCIKSQVISKLEKGVVSRTGELEAHIFQGDHETISKLKSEFETIPGVTLKITEVPFVTVPYQEHPVCWECKKDLALPYYWLKWEEGTHFACKACVEKPSTVPGHHFAYEKNSVFLNGKWEKIAVKGLGANLQPPKIEEQNSGHQFGCNGCGNGSGLGQARYICLGCRSEPNFNGDYVDLCQTCFELNIQGTEDIKEQLKSDFHHQNHPILRVLYNVSGYYSF